MTFANITDIVIPEGNVTMITDQNNNIIWQKSTAGEIPEWYGATANTDWSQRYMEIVPLADGTVDFTYIDYSEDGSEWASTRSTTTVSMTKYRPVFVKSDKSYFGIGNFTFDFYVRGNLGLSMTGNTTFISLFASNTHLIGAKYLVMDIYQNYGEYVYLQAFQNCTNLVTAPQLPATTLIKNCYAQMFEGCTSLTEPPSLPATVLAAYCYGDMFKNCTSLVNIPELPATNIVEHCYDSMFKGCTRLNSKAILPATTLQYQCYVYMFDHCSSLQYIKMLALTYTSMNMLYWVDNVAQSGVFVKHINASWNDTGIHAVPSGWTVIYFDP